MTAAAAAPTTGCDSCWSPPSAARTRRQRRGPRGHQMSEKVVAFRLSDVSKELFSYTLGGWNSSRPRCAGMDTTARRSSHRIMQQLQSRHEIGRERRYSWMVRFGCANCATRRSAGRGPDGRGRGLDPWMHDAGRVEVADHSAASAAINRRFESSLTTGRLGTRARERERERERDPPKRDHLKITVRCYTANRF